MSGELGGDKWFPLGECITFGSWAVRWVVGAGLFICRRTSSTTISAVLIGDFLPFVIPRYKKHRDSIERDLCLFSCSQPSKVVFYSYCIPNPPNPTPLLDLASVPTTETRAGSS